MADAEDILDLPKRESAAAGGGGGASTPVAAATKTLAQLQQRDQQRRLVKPPTEKKPTGLHRELYNLVGGAPPLAPASAGFKAKPNLGKSTATKWARKPFKNSARTDDLQLVHWAKVDDTTEEYMYARFNKTLRLLTYTDDEYERYFQDSKWTREETDRLFALCKQFDLRFPVIADRIEPPRSIEDAKARYFGISRKLIELRNDPSDPAIQSEMAKYNYDHAREVERKAQLNMLHRRTPAQVREEEYLLLEARKIEANAQRLLRARDEAIHLLAKVDSMLYTKSVPAHAGSNGGGGSGSAVGADGSTISVSNVGGLKKKKARLQEELVVADAASPAAAATTTGAAARGMSGGAVASPRAAGLAAPPAAEHGGSGRRKEKLSSGPYLRSVRALQSITGSSKMARRLDQFMEELGVSRPMVPTAAACKAFDELRQNVLTLLELKKSVDTRAFEVQVLRSRREFLLTGKEQPPIQPPPDHNDGKSDDDARPGSANSMRKRAGSDTGDAGTPDPKRSRH